MWGWGGGFAGGVGVEEGDGSSAGTGPLVKLRPQYSGFPSLQSMGSKLAC